MSYGNQLNIFRAKADRYGGDWSGIVLCRDKHEMKLAHEDAKQFLGGQYFHALQLLKMPNGAILRFRVALTPEETQMAVRGREFTQIIWLHRPESDEMRDTARAMLRSQTVPADDWRYEYCHIR